MKNIVDSHLIKTLHNYFDYAFEELQNSESVYHSLEGGVKRSSTIHAKRGNVCFEITLSMTSHRIAEDEV